MSSPGSCNKHIQNISFRINVKRTYFVAFKTSFFNLLTQDWWIIMWCCHFLEVQQMEEQSSVIHQKPSQGWNWYQGALVMEDSFCAWSAETLDHNICDGRIYFIWNYWKQCYQIIHKGVKSKAILQLLLPHENYISHLMFMHNDTILNYSIAY